MTTLRTIDLNNYIPVDDVKNATLKIIPFDHNGVPQIPLLFRTTREDTSIVDITPDLPWTRNAKISQRGTDEEYGARVDWYFENMSEEFKKELVDAVKDGIAKGFDIKMSVGKARAWAKSQVGAARKTQLSKFLFNWVTGGVAKMNRKWSKN